MISARVDGAVALLVAAAFETADRITLAELSAASRQLHSWLAAVDGRIANRTAQLNAEGKSEAPHKMLGGGRRSSKDAKAAARRGQACDLLPGLGAALAKGDVSPGHADAVANLAGKLSDAQRAELREREDEVVDAAKSSSVEEFQRTMTRLGQQHDGDDGSSRSARLRAKRCLQHWRDRVDEMDKFLLAADPDTAARIKAAHRAAMAAERRPGDDRTFDQRHADAFIALLLGAHRPGGGPTEVAVLVDLDTLRDGLHEHSVAETIDGEPLAADTCRRQACDADIIPVVLGSDGVVLGLGRAVRLATHEQRIALAAMHRTCAHPGCTVGFGDCRIHHVTPWYDGGTTDLDQLVPLCEQHHHLVHEGGWTLTLDRDRTVQLHRPDGETHHEGRSNHRTAAVMAALAGALSRHGARGP